MEKKAEQCETKSLDLQTSISSKRLNKLALLLHSAQVRRSSNDDIKPNLIPKSVKFLITRALKTSQGSNDRTDGFNTDNNCGADKGYEEENEESDFDNVSDMELSDESPDVVPSEKSVKKKPEKSNGVDTMKDLRGSGESTKVNGLHALLPKTTNHLDKTANEKIKRTSPLKPNTLTKSAHNKNAKLDTAVSKLLSSLQKANPKSKKQNNHLLVEANENSDASDSEILDGSVKATPNGVPDKVSPLKKDGSIKNTKLISIPLTNSSKKVKTNTSVHVNKVENNKGPKENASLTKGLDKLEEPGEKADNASSKAGSKKIEMDLSSDESSLCSLDSDNEGMLSDVDPDDATIPEPTISKERPAAEMKNEAKLDKVTKVFENETISKPQRRRSASVSSLSSSSSSSDESDGEGENGSSRGLPSRQSSVVDDVMTEDVAVNDAGDKEAVSLEDIFDFMGNPSPLSPMPLTPCPRSRTVSEASGFEETEVMQSVSESHEMAGSSQGQHTENDTEDKSCKTGTPTVAEEPASGHVVEVDEQDCGLVNKDTTKDFVEECETVATERHDSSSVSLSSTVPADLATGLKLHSPTGAEIKQVNESERLPSGNDVVDDPEKIKVAHADTEGGDISRSPESSLGKSKSPHMLRQITTRLSLGFVPSDSVVNEDDHLPSAEGDSLRDEEKGVPSMSRAESETSVSDKACHGETCQPGVDDNKQDQTSSSSSAGQNVERETNKLVSQESSGKDASDSRGGLDSPKHLNTSCQKSIEEESKSTSEKDDGDVTRSQTRLLTDSSSEQNDKSPQVSDKNEHQNAPRGMDDSSKCTLEDSYPLIELYVIKSPPMPVVGKQTRPPHSSPGDKVDEDSSDIGAGEDKATKNSNATMVTPLRMTRRRSSRLSSASDNCDQELSPSNKVPRRKTSQMGKILTQCPQEGSTSPGGPDSNEAKTTAEAERVVKTTEIDNVKELRNSPLATRERRRTRSSSVAGRADQSEEGGRGCAMESVGTRRTRRSGRLSSAESKKLKSPLSLSKTEGNKRGEIDAPDKTSSEHTGSVDNATVKSGPASANAVVNVSPKHDLSISLDHNYVGLLPTKVTTLNQEPILSEVQEVASLGETEKQDKYREELVKSRQKRLSGTSNVEKSTYMKEEGAVGHQAAPVTKGNKKGHKAEDEGTAGTGTAESRRGSALTRKTQMEIAAQQLARMLMAAKASHKKKSELARTKAASAPSACKDAAASKSQGSIKTEGNVSVTKRGRGRPRKKPLVSEKNGDVSTTASRQSKQEESQPERVKKEDKTPVAKGKNNGTESDLDTSSLSSDSDNDVEKGKQPKKKLNLKATRLVQSRKRRVGSASQKGTESEKCSPHNQPQQQQVETPSLQNKILPALSSSDSEDESPKTGTKANPVQQSEISSPGNQKFVPAQETMAPTASALPNCDLEGEKETSEPGKAFQQSAKDEQDGLRTKTSRHIAEEQLTAGSELAREEGENTPQVETLSITADSGQAAKAFGDSKLNRTQLRSSKMLEDEEGGRKVENKQIMSGRKDRKSLGNANPGTEGLRIKSKEFISSSSDDDDDGDGVDRVKISGNKKPAGKEKSTKETRDDGDDGDGVKLCGTDKFSEKEETVKERLGSCHQSESSKPCEIGARNECNGSGNDDFLSKRLSRFPHLFSSFVPSQFSAFRVTKSPKGKSTPGKEQRVSDTGNLPQSVELNHVNSALSVGDRGDKSNGEDPSLVISAGAKDVKKPSTEKLSASTIGEEDKSENAFDTSSISAREQVRGHAESRTSYDDRSDSEEEEERPLYITETVGSDHDGADELSAFTDTKGDYSSKSNNTGKTVIDSDGGSQPELPSCNTGSENNSPTDLQGGTSPKPACVAESLDEPSGLTLVNQSADDGEGSQNKATAKKERKRKTPSLETSGKILSSAVDSGINKGLKSYCSKLEEIFSFFRVTRCLSPLPRSPSPKKLCRDDDEDLSNSCENLVQFSSAAPDKAVIVTPAVTRVPLVKPRMTDIADGETYGSGDCSGQEDEDVAVPVTAGNSGVVEGSAVGRRSRSLDTTSVSFSQQMLQARKLLTARRKMADSGFLTPYAAVLNDLQQFASKGGDVAATASCVLTRFDGREVKPFLALLPQLLVEFMNNQKEEDILSKVYAACDEIGSIIDAVFASPSELRLAKIVSHLAAMDKGYDNSSVMGAIWNEVFKQEKPHSQLSVLSYCRLFTLLCMENGDVEQVRVLVYNVAWCGHLPLWPCLATIIGVWPQVFDSSSLGSSEPIMRVLACMLRSTYSQEPEMLSKVCQVTQRLCRWELKEKGSEATQVLKSLKDRLALLADKDTDHSVPGQMFAIEKAMELLFVSQGDEWTNKHFFRGMMVSVAMRWHLDSGEETKLNPALVIAHFKVFRAVTAVFPLIPDTVSHLGGQVFSRFLRTKKSKVIKNRKLAKNVTWAAMNVLMESSDSSLL
ncbi:hypothetical protein ElyMa_006848100 [Elysia marginata]|uniref:Uncharacterized protein n=1 Tax=Elysia marginata TaxID=1093978 RepID=A0AAV4J9U2_9GAST|nr:hypothetical protein ElyMa_006848100 [Elysia marginata]